MTELPKGEELLPLLPDLPPAVIAEECYADPALFCRFFLPHMFPSPLPWVHLGLLAVLTRRTDFLLNYPGLSKIVSNFVFERDEKTHSIFAYYENRLVLVLGRYTLVMLPRGFAKTTIAGNGVPLYDIAYHNFSFGAYVSEANPHAELQLANIKNELEGNLRFKYVFGNLRPDRTSGLPWASGEFETTTGTYFVSKGRGSQIRGLLHKGKRPQKIICDDLEDKESVSTALQRAKTRQWAYGDLLPALHEMDNSSTITVLGTLLGSECLLKTFAADPQWTVIRFGAYDRQGELLWPENLSEEKLRTKKQSFVLAGELHTFYLEYHNEERSPETQLFKPEYFVRGVPAESDGTLHTAIYMDPAISESERADEAAIYVAGMASKTGRIFVLDEFHARGASPRTLIDEFFRLHKKWKCSQAGIEGVAYQRALVHLCKEEMFRKKHYFEVVSVKHTNKQSKEQRIKGILHPRYASGYIVHSRVYPELETQLLDFGTTNHDDHPDALAGCVSLLDPYAAAAAGDFDLGEDEYEPLTLVFRSAP